MRLQIELLGRFAVYRDGQRVAAGTFGGQLAQRLVRLLVLRRGEVLTRDVLIDSLWGERAPGDPEANLNVVVNRARRALGDPALIETVAGGYVFSAAADVTVDVERFEADLRTARDESQRGRVDRALRAVSSALQRWRGEPLPEDAYAEWSWPHRDRLERARQETLELGAAAALGAGEPARACDLALQAITLQPLRETAHLLHIRALAACGDVAGALTTYEGLRTRLADELGIDPSRELTELHQALLRGEVVVDGRARAAGGAVPAPGTVAPVLVGREQELARLREVRSAQRVGLVSGKSGSGKSRLLQEFVAGAGGPVLSARAVLPERESPWSLARTLLRAIVDAGAEPAALPARSRAALAELVPEIADSDVAVVMDAQSRRALALEGAIRLLASLRQVLIIVDDLQWTDASSLGLLATFASRVDEAAIILAYRPEEVPAGHEVAGFLADLRDTGVPLEIQLGPLDAPATERLVGDGELAALLAEVTDGSPFAILEVIRALEQQDAVRRVGDVWRPASADVLERARAEARAGQQRAVAVRAGRQPRAARELLDMLALLGRPAPIQLLAQASGATAADIETQLDGLARAALVRHTPRGWCVAHDLVGETLRERLEPMDSARLHQLLARALETDPGADVARAHHLAGAGDQPAATVAYAAAARKQLARCADREAEQLAQAGLDLEPSEPIRVELLEVRGQCRVRSGALQLAREDLRAALALAASATDRARMLTRLAALASGSDDLVRAANLVDLALVEAGEEPRTRARALAVGAIVDMNLERPQRAETRYGEALALFERVGDAAGVADILDARAMAAFLDGDITGGIAAFERVARLFTDAGDLLRVVTPRSTRGHGLVFSGKQRDGLSDTDAALELAQSLGNLEGQAYAQWHRSEALTACGDVGGGVAAATEALAIAERLGHRGWTATALRALGIAYEAGERIVAAEHAFRRSLATSEHLPLFACWAHARLGLVLARSGRFEEAASHVECALATGPPLGHYEARLARCEIAVARDDPAAPGFVADAVDRATRGGHQVSLGRLSSLLRR